MDKKDDFELDFDFEKEYGFSPEDIMDPQAEGDDDFDLGIDLDLGGDSGDFGLDLSDDEILTFPTDRPAPQPAAEPEPEPDRDLDFDLGDIASTGDGEDFDFTRETAPAEPEDFDPALPQEDTFEDEELPELGDEPKRKRPKKSGFAMPPIFSKREAKPRRQNPLKARANAEGTEQPAYSPADGAADAPIIPREPNPRRKKRNQMRMIKEDYLPLGIAGVALLLCLVFIVGSVVRTIQNNKIRQENEIAASQQAESEAARLEEEVQRIRREAAELANSYDYAGAIALIDSFEGNLANYTELLDDRGRYAQIQTTMVEISDFRSIPNLSFHVLIADPATAFSSKPYGPKYLQNFVTIDEFERILEQLYENGYVLVNFDDFIEEIPDGNGGFTFQTKSIHLPAGKKPIMITETLVNYFDYMVDGDDDGVPDKSGDGFACKLVVKNGEVTAMRINSAGETVYGDYDLVPILNTFIEENPDFSYRGARATLAVTGAEGIFGYRINKGDAAEIEACKELLQALRRDGYLLACNSYSNVSYATIKTTDIQADLEKWKNQIAPVIGDVDILVYALSSDISDYNGSKYNALKAAGFNYFISNTTNGIPSTEVNVEYVRQYRIMVTGSMMINSPDSLAPYFSVSQVLNNDR